MKEIRDCPDDRTCLNEYYIEELERVAKAAAVILRAIKRGPKGFLLTGWEPCPHGNAANQPWFCDDCFLELEDALEEVDDFLPVEEDCVVEDVRIPRNIRTTRAR